MPLTTASEAERSIQSAEVQELMQRLAAYGLGVFAPHMHTSDNDLVPLPRGVIQFEADLRVSFPSEDDPQVEGALPVGWVWDEGVRVVGRCRQGHTLAPHGIGSEQKA